MNTLKLRDVAIARSGDKGNHANIGVVAKSPDDYKLLHKQLTAECVAAYFAGLRPARVERFEMPNIHAFNFLLYDVLDGGASRSLRFDTQGKLLGTALLDIELEPDDGRRAVDLDV
jgi:hypothetical protein